MSGGIGRGTGDATVTMGGHGSGARGSRHGGGRSAHMGTSPLNSLVPGLSGWTVRVRSVLSDRPPTVLPAAGGGFGSAVAPLPPGQGTTGRRRGRRAGLFHRGPHHGRRPLRSR